MKNFILSIVFLFVTTVAFATTLDLGFKKVFENNMGTVTFDHLSHVTKDCVACHTAMKENGGVDKKFAHSFCKDCHKVEAGPTKCQECHIK